MLSSHNNGFGFTSEWMQHQVVLATDEGGRLLDFFNGFCHFEDA